MITITETGTHRTETRSIEDYDIEKLIDNMDSYGEGLIKTGDGWIYYRKRYQFSPWKKSKVSSSYQIRELSDAEADAVILYYAITERTLKIDGRGDSDDSNHTTNTDQT